MRTTADAAAGEERVMRRAVEERLYGFLVTVEGEWPWMYADPQGLIQTAVGNLIDPVETALALPWFDKTTGAPASRSAVRAEWQRIKRAGSQLDDRDPLTVASATNLRLDAQTIVDLVHAKARGNEVLLRKHFPHFVDMPSDAQLGLHSMAWVIGAGFAASWPRFTAEVNVGDYREAADSCAIEGASPSIVLQNAANRVLFRNAAVVIEQSLSRDLLIYQLDASRATRAEPLPGK
jgi:hypothetical protein